MTKEQFISGTPFYIGGKKYKGDSTYTFDDSHISRQTRSSINEKVVTNDYECNVVKVGRSQFTAFTYVMGKRVVVKLKFSDLVPYETEISVGE